MPDMDKLESAGDLPELIAALKDDSPAVRGAAAAALGRVGDEQAIGPLVEALSDPYSYNPIEGEENYEQLREWASEEEYPVRKSAEKALKLILTRGQQSRPNPYTLKENGDVAGLVALLEDEGGDEVARLWRSIDDPALQSLIAELETERRISRRGAAEVLGIVGDARAVEPLISALGDEDSELCRLAANAVGRYRDARAVEPLIALLQHEQENVRESAARALGDIGDPRAVEPLIAALASLGYLVRGVVAYALRKIGDERAIGPLEVALQDSEEFVRDAAQEALDEIRARGAGG